MVTISSYPIAVLLCILTMICWGSWANTQKLAARTWRFELFYWDFVLGLVLMSLVAALTLGSFGSVGRPFLADLAQADLASIGWAVLGGAVWNAGNLLLVAAIAVAGMAVGFPVGGGIAWVLGIVFSFLLVVIGGGTNPGNSTLLWVGVAIIVVAIFLSMKAYSQLVSAVKKPSAKGITLSVAAGLLIAFFYSLTVKSIDPAFVSGGSGKLMPLTAAFFFTLGAFATTFLFNPFFMRKPVEGAPVAFGDYFKGTPGTHLTGVLGGAIWSLGLSTSFIAVGAAGPAVSYALSNAAPVVAILWGVLVWKEFAAAPRSTGKLLGAMFLCYLAGLVLITWSRL
ncbi:MAG: AcrB/AcrD/AcrF family protein [Terracidiphilus sp.]|nr:AcrB/AcrD/AcrF family protein [Terracidiphilus sp.]